MIGSLCTASRGRMKNSTFSAIAGWLKARKGDSRAADAPPPPTTSDPALFALLDRNFFELWLNKISSGILKQPTKANPEISSFLCQVAAAACLQETRLRSSPDERDLDGCMHLVATLWPITPGGASEHLGAAAWRNLSQLPWDEVDSAWHNLHAIAHTIEFRAALERLYSKFPQLTSKDCRRLASASPVITTSSRNFRA